ncbi:MAG: tetratricopeptide repeat protein, partial [Chitinophagales bacterium]|nr:tetratricopeptide repeat protein [Chitinophagales bacterium]
MTGYQKAQQKIKSLEEKIAASDNEQEIVDCYNSLSHDLFVYELDRSFQYAREARIRAQKINYKKGIGYSFNNEALGCRIRSDFKKSKQLSQEALKLFEEINDKVGQAEALNNIAFMEVVIEDFENGLQHSLLALSIAHETGEKDIEAFASLVIGMVYELLGDYPDAIDHHLKSLTLSRLTGDQSNEGAALIQLGQVFRKINAREKALENFQEANKIFSDLQIPLLEAASVFHLGTIYSETGDYTRALEFLRRSMQIQKAIGHAQGQGACFMSIGIVYQKIKNWTEAEENIRQSIELARSFGKKNYECKGMLQLAECLLEQGNENEAINLLDEAHNQAEIYGIKEIRFQILNGLSKAHEIKGDHKKSFTYFKEATALREKLINEESSLKNKGLMLLHEVETAKRERETAINDKLRAEQSEKFKEQFLANMSHEIRTPMNAITGLVDLLAKTKMDQLQTKYLSAIHQSADNLLGIIQDILDFSKIEAGQVELEEINFSVSECIESVYSTLQYKAHEKSIALEYSFDQKIPKTLSGDPVRLKQILINLTGNAIKFTERGSVKISCSQSKLENNKHWISFYVTDTGIGIHEDKLDDIFKSFVQAASSTTRVYGGTGLGLSISKYLVELQKGAITVNSKLGEGTTFTFLIPYGNAIEEKEKIIAYQKAPANNLKGIKILLVEDNQFNRMVAVDSLQSMIADVEIEIAENGKIALDKIHEKQ